MGFPGVSAVKESSCNARDTGLIPGLARFLGGRNDNLLQYSCLENPMDRGTWWATVHEVAKSRAWLSNWPCTCAHTMRTEGEERKLIPDNIWKNNDREFPQMSIRLQTTNPWRSGYTLQANYQNTTLKHIIFKIKKIKDKEKNLERIQE